MHSLCVAIHAVSPAHWPQCRRLAAAVRAVADVPLTWLVVPDLHGRSPRTARGFESALDECLAAGDELALHGYHHRDDSPPPVELLERVRRRFHGGCQGEFSALPEIEARARLVRGREWFRRRGWPLAGFVPPAGLLSPGAARAVRQLGFEYTATLGAFHALRAARTVRAPCLGWNVPDGTQLRLAMAWNETLARVSRGAIVLRIALHPADADRRDVLRQAQRLLADALRERTPMTKSALAGALAGAAVSPARRALTRSAKTAGAPVRAGV